jgi:hypothetical protein
MLYHIVTFFLVRIASALLWLRLRKIRSARVAIGFLIVAAAESACVEWDHRVGIAPLREQYGHGEKLRGLSSPRAAKGEGEGPQDEGGEVTKRLGRAAIYQTHAILAAMAGMLAIARAFKLIQLKPGFAPDTGRVLLARSPD